MVSERFKKWLDDPVVNTTIESSPRRLEMLRRTQEIIFDWSLCTDAGTCLKCLKACSPHVLAFISGTSRLTGQRVRPDRIVDILPETCSLCRRCVEVCPKKAVSIKVNGGRKE